MYLPIFMFGVGLFHRNTVTENAVGGGEDDIPNSFP